MAENKVVDLVAQVAEPIDVVEVISAELIETASTTLPLEIDTREQSMALTVAVNVVEPVKVQALQADDCDCMFVQTTTWHPIMGRMADYGYRDQDGRNWGYDASCGGQVKSN